MSLLSHQVHSALLPCWAPPTCYSSFLNQDNTTHKATKQQNAPLTKEFDYIHSAQLSCWGPTHLLQQLPKPAPRGWPCSRPRHDVPPHRHAEHAAGCDAVHAQAWPHLEHQADAQQLTHREHTMREACEHLHEKEAHWLGICDALSDRYDRMT
jgi:hypothetical protein